MEFEMKLNQYIQFTLVATVLGIASAVVTPAHAGNLPGDINRYVTFYDVNKDGMVSRVEMMKMAAEKFDKMADKNGMLDSKKAMEFLLELTKGDGNPVYMMSKADMLKKVGEMFDKFDSSKAGMLNKKQFESFLLDLMKSAG
jgi:Ca2+-binding EF-hand superfamily protein